MTTDPIKQAWRDSVGEPGELPLDEVRAGADRFYRFVRRRNVIEYAACAVAVAVFGFYVFWLPHVLEKIGSVLVVIAVFYTAFQLHRRASAVPPETAGTMPVIQFARGQLARHRDALRSIFRWYLLPFTPGLALIVVGSASRRAGETTEVVMPGKAEWLFIGFAALVFAVIWWLNQRIANKLQASIDELDALAREKD